MQEYINQFISLVDGYKLIVIVCMIIANLLTGVAMSLYTKTFKLKDVANFLSSRVLPMVVGYFAIGIVAVVESTFEALVTVVFGVIVAALVGAIYSNLKECGINLPEIDLSKIVTKKS